MKSLRLRELAGFTLGQKAEQNSKEFMTTWGRLFTRNVPQKLITRTSVRERDELYLVVVVGSVSFPLGWAVVSKEAGERIKRILDELLKM